MTDSTASAVTIAPRARTKFYMFICYMGAFMSSWLAYSSPARPEWITLPEFFWFVSTIGFIILTAIFVGLWFGQELSSDSCAWKDD